MGSAFVTPLSLTILSSVVSPQRRGLALGAWGGVAGLAVAAGPLVGGAVVQGISWQGISWQGISWQWIFWLNVPIGLAVLPLAITRLTETTGPNRSLDLPGLGLVSAGLFSLVFGLVRASEHGWGSLGVAGPLAAGAALVVPFVLAGVGMSLFFAPTANVVLSAVRRDEEGKASGVNNTMREIGGVFGVAVLATVFSAVGATPRRARSSTG